MIYDYDLYVNYLLNIFKKLYKNLKILKIKIIKVIDLD